MDHEREGGIASHRRGDMPLPKQTPFLIALLAIVVLAAACGGNGDSDGNATNGDSLAPGPALFISSGCSACHTIDSVSKAAVPVGPNLSNIGGRADAAYIRESILDPNAVIAASCPTGPCRSGVMSQAVGLLLSQDELDVLVRYLSSLA